MCIRDSPLRRRVQDALDRRFYRRKYDAAKVLQGFAATARDETDLDRLTAELVRVIEEAMQPEFASVWLVDSGSAGERGSGGAGDYQLTTNDQRPPTNH